jgi:hypothetical protein
MTIFNKIQSIKIFTLVKSIMRIIKIITNPKNKRIKIKIYNIDNIIKLTN